MLWVGTVFLEDNLAKFIKQGIKIAVPFDQIILLVEIFPLEIIQEKKKAQTKCLHRARILRGEDREADPLVGRI